MPATARVRPPRYGPTIRHERSCAAGAIGASAALHTGVPSTNINAPKQQRDAGIRIVSLLCLSTRAARARRDNLQRSAEELTTQLDEARLFLDEALAGPGKGQILDGGGATLLAG